jgi:hypothetical protein
MAFERTPFDDWMDEHAALVDGKWFYGRVAGTDRVNENKMSRQASIGTLVPQDELRLEPEPGNSYDPNAVKVLAPDGNQIGYLEARLAAETTRRAKRGIPTRAFVSNLTGRPGQTRGVTIAVLVLVS